MEFVAIQTIKKFFFGDYFEFQPTSDNSLTNDVIFNNFFALDQSKHY